MDEGGGSRDYLLSRDPPPLVHFLFLFVLSAFHTEEVIAILIEKIAFKEVISETIIIEINIEELWVIRTFDEGIEVDFICHIFKPIIIASICFLSFLYERIGKFLLNFDFCIVVVVVFFTVEIVLVLFFPFEVKIDIATIVSPIAILKVPPSIFFGYDWIISDRTIGCLFYEFIDLFFLLSSYSSFSISRSRKCSSSMPSFVTHSIYAKTVPAYSDDSIYSFTVIFLFSSYHHSSAMKW